MSLNDTASNVGFSYVNKPDYGVVNSVTCTRDVNDGF
jgi:hypothetical protein